MAGPITSRRYSLEANTAIKTPCRVATTANITLSGLQAIDGITVVADDRVLVKNQTTQTQNGIYVASTSTWQRDYDFDGSKDVVQGTLVPVYEGTANSATIWQVTTANPITVGTSNITFALRNNALTGVSALWLSILDETTESASRNLLQLSSTTVSTQSNPLPIAAGGHGTTSSSGARAALELTTTTISSASRPLPVADGGSGSTDAAGARTNLSVASSSDLYQVSNATSDTTGVSISNQGITSVVTTTDDTWSLSDPTTSGRTKQIIATSTSTGTHTVQTAAATIITTAGSSFRSMIFNAIGEQVMLVGLSTSQWAVIGTPTCTFTT